MQGLDYPSAITWDANGSLYVLESHTVPVPLTKRRILKVVKEHLEEVKMEGPDAPTGARACGLTFHEGWLYLSHEQADGTFGISRVRPRSLVATATFVALGALTVAVLARVAPAWLVAR